MQNVSNLVIPEGEVRTIHDKNSRLLWGKLSYDTKYAGNTIQDGSPTPDAPVAIQTVTGAQTVTITGKNLFSSPVIVGGWNANGTANMGASAKNRFKSQDKIAVLPSTTYTLSGDPKISGKTLQSTVQTYNASETIISQLPSSSTFATLPYTFTTPSNCYYITISGRYSDNTQIGSTLGEPTDAIMNVQLEQGSTRTFYEPYQSHDYIVDLGIIELCKLGNYQDYIYKSGDDWYLHKDINREDLDGSSDEQWVHQTGGGDTYHNWFQHNFEYPSVATNERLHILSNNFTNIGSISYQNTTEGMGTLTGNVRFRWNMGEINTSAKWRAFLGEHPTTVYYMMDTSIETQITDATLISQLDDIHQFLTRYGYNSTVSGNLPLIISKTNL